MCSGRWQRITPHILALCAFTITLATFTSLASAQVRSSRRDLSAQKIDLAPVRSASVFSSKTGNRVRNLAPGAVRYKAIQIGVLPGKTNSVITEEPSVINNRGHVAGFSFVYTGDFHDFYLTAQPFLWKDGQLHSLPLLTGWPGAFATGVNDRDQAIGEANNFDSNNARRRTAVMWNAGQVTNLGTLDSNSDSAAFGINNWGVAAGFNRSFITGHRTAVVWYSGAIHPLPFLPGQTDAFAFGINDAGVIAGYQFPPDDSTETPCLWYWNGSGYVAVALSTLGGNYGNAYDVNLWGQTVGSATTVDDATGPAVLWNLQGAHALSSLPGDVDGTALAINELGQIVGFDDDVGEVVLWQHGTVLDLQTAVPASTPPISDVGNVNNLGQIAVETGFFDDGSLAAYVLEPKDN
jgi:uncharacterized membrane protein